MVNSTKVKIRYPCHAKFGAPQNLVHLEIITTLWDKNSG